MSFRFNRISQSLDRSAKPIWARTLRGPRIFDLPCRRHLCITGVVKEGRVWVMLRRYDGRCTVLREVGSLGLFLNQVY